MGCIGCTPFCHFLNRAVGFFDRWPRAGASINFDPRGPDLRSGFLCHCSTTILNHEMDSALSG